MKKPQWSDTVLLLMICVGVAAVPFAVCGSVVGPGSDEVARVVSPAGSFEAVVVEWDGGATTDVGHDVYVIAAGGSIDGHRPFARFYGAHLNDRAWGVACRWSSARTLVVEYDTTRGSELAIPRATLAGQDVVVELVAGRAFPELEGKMVDRMSSEGR